MLDIDEIEELLDEIRIRVLQANRAGTLEPLLANWGMSELLKPTDTFESFKDGKIVVIGGSDVREEVLAGIAVDMGIDKKRLEFCLNYEKAQKYDYRKLQYAPQYRVVLFGAVPHSSTGKGDSSSVISELKKKEGYPRVELLCSNESLKITKSNFREKIQQLITEKYI